MTITKHRYLVIVFCLGLLQTASCKSLHSDRSECKKHGLDYVKISAQAWEAEEDEVEDFMKIATDPERKPVFVHCQHGADRTGMMVAVYRVVEMGWTKEEAIREMTVGGYGYHGIWKGLLTYIKELDVSALEAKIRRK
jgi:protein tyrosine/serine phosphatase